MKSLLEIKSGERPYKMGVSQWLSDKDGAVLFKVISKMRQDGQVEFIYYSQRGDGRKIVMEDIIIAEGDFWRVMGYVRESLEPFFPAIGFKVENIDFIDTGQSMAARADKFGVWKLLFLSSLKCRWAAAKVWLKNIFK